MIDLRRTSGAGLNLCLVSSPYLRPVRSSTLDRRLHGPDRLTSNGWRRRITTPSCHRRPVDRVSAFDRLDEFLLEPRRIDAGRSDAPVGEAVAHLQLAGETPMLDEWGNLAARLDRLLFEGGAIHALRCHDLWPGPCQRGRGPPVRGLALQRRARLRQDQCARPTDRIVKPNARVRQPPGRVEHLSCAGRSDRRDPSPLAALPHPARNCLPVAEYVHGPSFRSRGLERHYVHVARMYVNSHGARESGLEPCRLDYR